MPSLTDLIFNVEAQRAFVGRCADALHRLRPCAVPGKLYGAESAKSDAKVREGSVTAATLLKTLTAPAAQNGDQIAGYFQHLAAVEQSRPVLLLAVFGTLVLFPRAAAEVQAETPSNFGPFFAGNGAIANITTRFEQYLTGADGTDAKLPIEIVAAELVLYHRLAA